MIILNVFFTLMVLYFIIYFICSFRAYTKLCTLIDNILPNNKPSDMGNCYICKYWDFVLTFGFRSWNYWGKKLKIIKIFILPFAMLKTISKVRDELIERNI